MDWTPIIVAVIAALPGTLLGVATLRQGIAALQEGRKTHASVNSKMDLLLETTKAVAYARGLAAKRAVVKKVSRKR